MGTRRGAIALLLALGAGCSSPQPLPPPASSPPGPPPARVALAVGTVIEGAGPARPVELQGVLLRLLGQGGLRVESLSPLRDPALESLARRESELAEREGQPVSLRISGEIGATYADAAFYGQPLAHNFHGQVDVLLTDEQGEVLRRIAFLHSWGRLRQSRTLDETLGDWEDVVHGTVVVGLLSHPRVLELVPEAARAGLGSQVAELKERLLRRLDRSAPECEAAVLLRSW